MNSPIIQLLQPSEIVNLSLFLEQLPTEVTQWYQPHSFTVRDIQFFYNNTPGSIGFISIEPLTGKIIGYAALLTGGNRYDIARWQQYQYSFHPTTVASYAPVIAPAYQGIGLAKKMFDVIIAHCNRHTTVRKLLLWGGVKAENEKAIRFYEKIGFANKHSFEYQGLNYDFMYAW
jgi:GNAT superfamily N-acetyltransferase